MYFCSLMTEDLKEKTAKGLMWGAIANGGTQVLNLLIGIVLANLLLPSDYGIVGLLTIFTVLAASLSSSGFANGLINKSPSDNDYNSVFWFNVTVSIVCYVILFCCAPLIARFFHQPILVPLSRFVFLCFIITASGMSYNAYMVKNMMNREIAIISLLALVISGAVGIVLAWLDKGVWSLAWQQMIYILVTNLGRYWYVPWHPRFRFDPAPIKELFPSNMVTRTISGEWKMENDSVVYYYDTKTLNLSIDDSQITYSPDKAGAVNGFKSQLKDIYTQRTLQSPRVAYQAIINAKRTEMIDKDGNVMFLYGLE